MEAYHQLQGFIAAYQGKAASAAAHFAEGNLQDPYIEYQYATALDASGQSVGEPPQSSFDVQVRAAGSLLQAQVKRGKRAMLAVSGDSIR